MAIEFGRVPHPPVEIRQIEKPEGQGWDNLGKRTPRSVVLHRMIGTLWGTDSWFRQVNSLTDYGVGVQATDGLANAGRLLRWNDPRGYRSGWASGPVSKPYGDGLLFINRYGVNAVNRDCVSIEISGNYDTPLDPKAIDTITKLMAYWADQYRIPWDEYPLIKSEGRSHVIWHQEFTIGTGKICPGPVVMGRTDDLIDRVKLILKEYQEVPVTEIYVKPDPVPTSGGWDADLDGITYYAVSRRVRATGGSPFRAAASDTAGPTRRPAAPNEAFVVAWAVFVEGTGWWVTPYGSRIKMAHTDTRVTVSKG